MLVRLGDRLFGSILALLLQAGFLLILLQGVRMLRPPPKIVRELTLILPRLAQPAPSQPPRGTTRPAPAIALPSPSPLPAPPPGAAAPDAGALRGMGQSLFGCAPENYALLTQEQRTHCPKPGTNAPPSAEDDLYPRSHSKDAATWQEDLDERHLDYSGCMGATLVVTCMTEAAKSENARAAQRRREIEAEKQKSLAAPQPPEPAIPARPSP